MAVLLVLWTLTWVAAGAQSRRRSASLPASPPSAKCSRASRCAWVLALFYFLTFGGFVAFSIYLPTLLRDEFG